MKTIQLLGNNVFAVELIKDQLRLIVLNKGEEIACKKVKITALNKFLYERNASIFKGRLQLSMETSQIKVYVKGEKLGIINKTDFSALLPDK